MLIWSKHNVPLRLMIIPLATMDTFKFVQVIHVILTFLQHVSHHVRLTLERTEVTLQRSKMSSENFLAKFVATIFGNFNEAFGQILTLFVATKPGRLKRLF